MFLQTFIAVPWIVLAPAIGALAVGLLGKRWGDRFSAVAANLAVFGSFGISLYAYLFLLNDVADAGFVWTSYTFLDTDFIVLDIGFRFDRLSGVMALIVTGGGSLIHFYSIRYMKGDRSMARYFSHLNMLVFFMLLLVLGKNLLVMFIGWEGVGLCSYLLIGFRYEDMDRARAGKRAFILNRIGDFGFLLALILLLLYNQGSVDFASLEVWVESGASAVTNELNVTVICLLLFFGAIGKSAQVPLHVWLPRATAGPAPACALVNAVATVIAGVYMVARLSFLFVKSFTAMLVVAGAGAVIALFASAVAVAYVVYRGGPEGTPARLAAAFRPLHRLLEKKCYFDQLYALVVVRPLKAVAALSHKVVDTFMIDILGVNGAAYFVKGLGVIPRIFHNGNVQCYLFALVAGLLALWILL